MLNFFLLIITAVITFLSVSFGGLNAIMPTPTPVPTAAPTATPTLSPEPTITPVPTLSPEEEKEVLNQQFQDFLNKEGEFTEDKMSYFPIYPKEYKGTDKIKLGMLGVFWDSIPNDTCINVYGYFFDYLKTDSGDVILIMGFDGKDGKRFITPIEIASSVMNYYLDSEHENFAAFWIMEEGVHLNGSTSVAYKAYGSEELIKYLEDLVGKKIVVDIQARGLSLQGKEEKIDSVWFNYLEETNKQTPFARSFAHKLVTNGVDTTNIKSSYAVINEINDIDDLSSINFEKIIFADVIRYRRN